MEILNLIICLYVVVGVVLFIFILWDCFFEKYEIDFDI